MTAAHEALAWTYTILGMFAEAVQVGELSAGLDTLAGLSDQQRVDVINSGTMLLERGMVDKLRSAPARLSTFGGITIPRASELDVRGYTTPARRVLVSTWNCEVGEFVTDLAQRHGTKYTAGVVALGAACMLLTWQLETKQPLEAILDCL